MATVNIFTFVLRPVPCAIAGHPDAYQMVRENLGGDDDVLHQGSFYDCRCAMERCYQRLLNNSSHFTVYWRDEFSLLVYDHANELSTVAGCGCRK